MYTISIVDISKLDDLTPVEIPVQSGVKLSFGKKSASTMSFNYLPDMPPVENGYKVMLRYAGRLVWSGTVFKVDKVGMSVTAYCLIRYLKNPDVLSYKDIEEGITSEQFVIDACEVVRIPYKMSHAVGYKHKNVELDNQEYLTRIYEMLDTDFLETGSKLTLVGHRGFVTLIAQTDCIFNQNLHITSYSLNKDIDSETANVVIIFNKDKTKYEIASDTASIQKYGVLKMIKVADIEENLRYYADEYLKMKNTVAIKLSMNTLSNANVLNVCQGWIINVDIVDELTGVKVNGWFEVDSITHTILNGDFVESNISLTAYTEEML